ncbi:hypothetical protein BB560_000325 [Smittium megazygosporum]|uniref:TOG domain-containing protein n=1 Tax=Smittium megazygosporum TaxID=133381 RepID=A0A2T9ZKV0_9FUNG|nr:hypothetical protein BB560_000325 [Smittium megazygosporum]
MTEVMTAEESFSWPKYLEHKLVPIVNSNKVLVRTDFFSTDLPHAIKIHAFPEKAIPLLLKSLLPTTYRYNDRKSCLAVLQSLRQLSQVNPNIFADAVSDLIGTQVDKLIPKSISSYASVKQSESLRFSYLLWIDLACDSKLEQLLGVSKAATFDKSLIKIIDIQARLLWSLGLDKPSKLSSSKRRTILSGSLADVRRILRKHHQFLPQLISLLTAGDFSKAIYSGVLLGNCISTVLRLKQTSEYVPVLTDSKTKIVNYIKETQFSSRSLVPYTSISSLSDFIKGYIDSAIFESQLLPTIKKMFLRQPEEITHVLIWFVEYVSFDFSKYFAEYFAETLTNLLVKTSNKMVQNNCSSLFQNMSQKCKDSRTSITATKKTLEVLSKNKSLTIETKQELLMLVKTIASQPYESADVSSQVCDLILESYSKESQENIKLVLLEALGPHLKLVLLDQNVTKHNSIIQKIIEAVKKSGSFSGQTSAIRKGWIVSVIGQSIPSQSFDFAKISINSHFMCLVLDLFQIFEKFISNQVSSGIDTIEGYSLLSIFCKLFGNLPESKQEFLVQKVLSSSSDSSPFFIEKVYHKISKVKDAEIMRDTIIACYEVWYEIDKSRISKFEGQTISSALLEPLLWLYTNPLFEKLQFSILSHLSLISNKCCSFFTDQSISRVVNYMSESFLSISNSTPHENSPKIVPRTVFKFLSALVPGELSENDPTSVSSLIISLSIASYHPLAFNTPLSSYNWLDLFSKSKLDPFEVCTHNLDSLTEIISTTLLTHAPKDPVSISVFQLIQSLSFVLGESFIEKALGIAELLANQSNIENVSDGEKKIWDTPESMLAFDPLAIKESSTRKSNKDEDWEQKIKKEVAEKRLQSKKLTKEEQRLLDDQKEYESSVRRKVQTSFDLLSGSLCTISNSVSGNVMSSRNIANKIMDTLFKRILVLKNLGWLLGPFVGIKLIEVFNIAVGLNPSIRAPAAIALLRTNGLSSCCSEDWLAEPLEDLVTRLLFSVQIASSSDNFEASDFSIIFPILETAILVGGWGEKSKIDKSTIDKSDEYLVMDKPTEQLAMVSELLSLNAVKIRENMFPRVDYLKVLLDFMSRYPMFLGKARESFLLATNTLDGLEGLVLERNIVLSGLLFKDTMIRSTCLESLANFDFNDSYEKVNESDTLLKDLVSLWITTCDTDESLAGLALELWRSFRLSMSTELIKYLVSYNSGFLNHQTLSVRQSTSVAITSGIIEISKQNSRSENEESDDTETVELDPEASDCATYAIQQLRARYGDWYINLDPEYDRFGIVIPESVNKVDPYESRVTVAWSIKNISPVLPTETEFQSTMDFMIESEVFGERHYEVREAMLEAGLQLIQDHGGQHIEYLTKLFDSWLSKPDQDSEKHDYMREAVVVMLGSLASHFVNGDSRIISALNNLVLSLHTPSESVQAAVSSCLIGLSKKLDDSEVEKVINQLFEELISGKKYAVRRGAAYGLAGIIKGRGLSALRKFNIVDKLKAAANDRKNVNARQGSLFALEMFSKSLGRIFEPYMIQILPVMLRLFSDNNSEIREATSDTAKAIMSQLSGYGVKLVLPSLLSGLQNNHWRTKQGSIEMLGAMAFCAPTQLRTALPTVVPYLVHLLFDSHVQVSESAYQALANIGSVINNPEIIDLVPLLLDALKDPAEKTDVALSELLGTAFVHYIDAPSLALIAPVLERGMKERKTSTKRNASQVFGSMALLAEPADLAIYLPTMIPLLKSTLSDPVPETRGTSAKAFGKLVSKIGEANFENLIDELFQVLRSESISVDSAGAAQALSEILSGVGVERLDSVIPDVLTSLNSEFYFVRNGYMLLLLYLPSTFGDKFTPYIPKVLSPVLNCLSDDSEEVRKTSMRTGQSLVMFYSSKAAGILTDGLLLGLKDTSWRIRKSSVELLGDLLLRIGGKSGSRSGLGAGNDLFGNGIDNTQDEEAEESGEESDEEPSINVELIKKNIAESIGEKKLGYTMASLYILRNDDVASVRQASLGVWKTLTSNTPRTVKECLEPLVEIVLEGLSSDHNELRNSAAHTLGDMVRKLGNTVVERVIPILEKSLSNENLPNNSRQGIFIGLSEILTSSSSSHVQEYAQAIMPLVKVGICDQDPLVRESAALAFDSLQSVLGPKVLEEIIPFLLNALNNTQPEDHNNDGLSISADNALKALQELLSIRANLIIPTLIPTLISEPITAFNARALEALVLTAGTSTPVLTRRLSGIVLALFNSSFVHFQNGNDEGVVACRQAIMSIAGSSAKNEESLDIVMGIVFDAMRGSEVLKESKARESESREFRRTQSCYALASVFQNVSPGTATYIGNGLGKHISELLPVLIELMSSEDSRIYEPAHAALVAVCKAIPKNELLRYTPILNKAVKSAAKNLPSGVETIPGFNTKTGISPILSIYSYALLEGPPQTKELAVDSMSDLVRFTSQDFLKFHVTSLTGPLIRIVGDRIPPEVRASVINSLKLLLLNSPQFLRPFFPQLQRTFLKFLLENDLNTKKQSQEALSVLIPLLPRLDPLVSELCSGIKSMLSMINTSSPASDSPVYESCSVLVKSLKSVIESPGSKSLTESSKKSIEQCLLGNGAITVSNRQVQSAAADALPVFLRFISNDSTHTNTNSVAGLALANPDDTSDSIEGKMRITISLLQRAPDVLLGSSSVVGSQNLVSSIEVALNSKELNTVTLGIRAASLALQQELFYNSGEKSDVKNLSEKLIGELFQYVDVDNKNSTLVDNDIKQSVFVAFKEISKSPVKDCQNSIVESLYYHRILNSAFSLVRSRVIPLKLASEQCIMYALHLAKTSYYGETQSINTTLLDKYVQDVGGVTSEHGKIASDYYRRVLSKLATSTFEDEYTSEPESTDSSIEN